MDMLVNVIKVGSELGIIIPDQIISELNLTSGSMVDITFDAGVKVCPRSESTKKRFPYTENELLDGVSDFSSYE